MVEQWTTFHQKHHSTAFRSSCENKKLYGREPNITNTYSCHVSTQSLERQRHGRCSVRRIFGCLFRPLHRTKSNNALEKYNKNPSPTGVWNGPESSGYIYSHRKNRPRQGNLQFSLRPQWRSWFKFGYRIALTSHDVSSFLKPPKLSTQGRARHSWVSQYTS